MPHPCPQTSQRRWSLSSGNRQSASAILYRLPPLSPFPTHNSLFPSAFSFTAISESRTAQNGPRYLAHTTLHHRPGDNRPLLGSRLQRSWPDQNQIRASSPAFLGSPQLKKPNRMHLPTNIRANSTIPIGIRYPCGAPPPSQRPRQSRQGALMHPVPRQSLRGIIVTHRITGSCSTRANMTPSRSPQHKRGNQRPSLRGTMDPFHPSLRTRTRSSRPASRSHPAPRTDPRTHRPSLITNLATNQRRTTLSPPSSRSFIAISPSSSRRSSRIRANPKMRTVSSSGVAHRQEQKKRRRPDGRKRSRTTSSESSHFSPLYVASTCSPAFPS